MQRVKWHSARFRARTSTEQQTIKEIDDGKESKEARKESP